MIFYKCMNINRLSELNTTNITLLAPLIYPRLKKLTCFVKRISVYIPENLPYFKEDYLLLIKKLELI